MKHITFYLDIVSPYAWLAFERLPEVLEGLSYSVEYRPVLLGALLQHRLVGHAVAQALQRLRQALKGQPGVGREEVQVEGDVFHGAEVSCKTAGGATSARCSSRSQMARRSALVAPDHTRISSRLRKQPSHMVLSGVIRHTDTQGDSTIPSKLGSKQPVALTSLARVAIIFEALMLLTA